ncbi:MAG TPA: hypothetical protein VFB73_05865 [Chloroflexota bacterium]|nr:hypothetical protein [Chloroflexota bacterium]
MVQRALVILLGLPIVLFAWWGSWELARQLSTAPQAALGAVVFAAIGLVALAAVVLSARDGRW